MANRVKHMERSCKSRDRSGIYRKYVIGKSTLYNTGDYRLLHRLTNLFKHQSR
jgi:hypothetical protein